MMLMYKQHSQLHMLMGFHCSRKSQLLLLYKQLRLCKQHN
jgi:hypothetical protein